jgi:long-chain fatty acid transport protein
MVRRSKLRRIPVVLIHEEMRKMKPANKKTIVLALCSALSVFAAAQAGASGFALIEQSGSGMGNAFAGGAAVAEDASTNYFNPAGLSRLTTGQAVLGLHFINIQTEFNNNASTNALGQPLGTNGGDAGDLAVLPNLYLSLPVTKELTFGLGVNAPFGLKTEYQSDWIGRFQGIKSDVKTYNVNPSLAFKVNDMFSLGVGTSWQKIDAELTSAVNYTAVVGQGLGQLAAGGKVPPAAIPGLIAANAGLAGDSKVKGDDSVWGWNVGALFNLSPQTRFGIAYRSSLKYTVSGDVSFNAPKATEPTGALIIAGASAAGGPLANGPISLQLEVPDSASFSFFSALNPQWDIMGDVSWTGWSSVPELRILRSDGSTLSVTPEQWKDTWRYSFGANYHWDRQWMLRMGVAYDEAPVPDSTRTPRLPDNDRTWLAFGAQYKFSPVSTLDFGYAHLFVKDSSINQNAGNAAAYGLINGTYNTKIDIFSLQWAYNF